MTYIAHSMPLSFQRTREDDPTVPDGPEEIVEKGGEVPDYVTKFQLEALVSAGMVVLLAEPFVPDDVEPVGPVPPRAVEPVDEKVADEEPPAPKPTDNRATWENYAVERGMAREQAESYPNKAELIEAVSLL